MCRIKEVHENDIQNTCHGMLFYDGRTVCVMQKAGVVGLRE